MQIITCVCAVLDLRGLSGDCSSHVLWLARTRRRRLVLRSCFWGAKATGIRFCAGLLVWGTSPFRGENTWIIVTLAPRVRATVRLIHVSISPSPLSPLEYALHEVPGFQSLLPTKHAHDDLRILISVDSPTHFLDYFNALCTCLQSSLSTLLFSHI